MVSINDNSKNITIFLELMKIATTTNSPMRLLWKLYSLLTKAKNLFKERIAKKVTIGAKKYS
jgi:hypothetical protein